MTKAPRKTLRHLATPTLLAALALGSGCSGDFLTEGEGAVGGMMGDAVNADATGSAVLSLKQLPVDIVADDGFIIFDFSNVDEPGVLSTIDGEGYQLDGKVLGVSIDTEHTDADSDALVIQSDRNGVTINFDDLVYDDTTFIKIDVRFAATN
jgi:hypothetical protein